MIKLLSAIVISLLAGFTIVRIAVPVNETPDATAAGRPVIDRNEPLDARIAALERAVREERGARQVLQDELTYIYIVRYGGERVFNTYDLNRRILAGRPGETVLVDVRRDGAVFQVTMPRGPLGIRGR